MIKRHTSWAVALVFGCIWLLAVGMRLYHVSADLGDWHSWRQVDTAAVARNFLRFGIDPLHPRYDDLSNIQSGKDNPMGFRMVEFPLYQYIAAHAFTIVPTISLELWLRLLTIIASATTAVLVGLLVCALVSTRAGLLAALVYAVLPYSMYYGRTILPDGQMVFWSVLSIFALWQYFGQARSRVATIGWLLVSAVAAGCALLSKPMAVFLLLPSGYLFWQYREMSKKWLLGGIIYAAVGLIPFILWRRWILQFPEGIAVSTWLLNANNIRFKGAWFYWLFARRLPELILGYWGLIPFALGIAVLPKPKEGWLFRWWLIGGVLYITVFAAGNVQHDYYQILLLPTVAVFTGKGFDYILSSRELSKISAFLASAVIFIFMLMFSWYTIRTYYWINHPEIIAAGQAADRLLPKFAKVIAPYNGDTTFLYQTKRQGWPLGFDIDKKIAQGAEYYVTVSPTDNDFETKTLAEKYTVLVRNDRFAIIDLTRIKHR